MVIDDPNELNALHKLLAKVKFSDQIDSFDLNEFAGSPIITNLFKKVREEHLKNLKAEGHEDLVSNWLKNQIFKFDSDTGKAITKRLKHLSPSALETIKNWDYENVRSYAQDLVEPLSGEPEEIGKLADYIISLVKEK